MTRIHRQRTRDHLGSKSRPVVAALGITVVAAAATLVAASFACAPTIRSTRPGPPTPAQMAELWVEPANAASRDLFHGPGGAVLTPKPGVRYEFVKADRTGFSKGWDVRDPNGVEWSTKHGPEAQTEVVASRLIWAVGYHQPPTYYVDGWTLSGGDSPGPQPPSRFRPGLPWQKKTDTWSWHRNPFVGTRPYRGLLVLMVMLTNSDLKESNNALYELAKEAEGARRWYVVRDVGHSFGRTGVLRAPRNDVEEFEKHGFIDRVENGRVTFEYHGLHREVLEGIEPADVRWICERLARLTPTQWSDAFRAGGYAPEESDRFIRKLQQKIEQGRKLMSDGPQPKKRRATISPAAPGESA